MGQYIYGKMHILGVNLMFLKWAKFEANIYSFILQLFIEYYLCSGHDSYQEAYTTEKKKPQTENGIKLLFVRNKHNSHVCPLVSMHDIRKTWTLWQH